MVRVVTLSQLVEARGSAAVFVAPIAPFDTLELQNCDLWEWATRGTDVDIILVSRSVCKDRPGVALTTWRIHAHTYIYI